MSYDVVVVGGGLVGLAVVHHLRRLAPAGTTIALVEPSKPGRLTSAASTGGYRNYYPADANLTQLAQRSIELLEEIARQSNNGTRAEREGLRAQGGCRAQGGRRAQSGRRAQGLGVWAGAGLRAWGVGSRASGVGRRASALALRTSGFRC